MGTEFSEVLAAADVDSLPKAQQATAGTGGPVTESSQAESIKNEPLPGEGGGTVLESPDASSAPNASPENERQDESTSPGLRRYSEEEDDLILEMWHDKRLRPELSQKLNRPLGGLAYRFYQILKERGMDPSQYRREMRAQKLGRSGRPPKPSPKVEGASLTSFWNARLDINLWKWRRSGEDWQTIAGKIPGATPASCEERYNFLSRRNRNQSYAGSESGASEGSGAAADLAGAAEAIDVERLSEEHGIRPKTSAKTDQDILTALKYFPDRAAELEARMQHLEGELKSVREQNGIRLGDLISSLARVDEVLSQRDRLADEVEALHRQNEELEAQLAEELRKIEVERQELQQVYNDLDTMLSDFMRLSSVDKLRVLGDFAGRLEVTVDKFGNVVRTRRRI